MKQTRFLGALSIVAVALFILVPNVLMVQRPRQFYLEDPLHVDERRRLVGSLVEEMSEMKESETEPKEWGYLYDADSLWPMDSYTIVIALERFILEENTYPDQMGILYSSEFLSPSDLNGKYVLELENGTWRVKRDESFVLVAEGN